MSGTKYIGHRIFCFCVHCANLGGRLLGVGRLHRQIRYAGSDKASALRTSSTLNFTIGRGRGRGDGDVSRWLLSNPVLYMQT